MSVISSLPNPDISKKSVESNFKLYLSGLGYHNFVGYDTFVSVVGYSLSKRLFREAFWSPLDTYTRHLRRGLKIEIYSK